MNRPTPLWSRALIVLILLLLVRMSIGPIVRRQLERDAIGSLGIRLNIAAADVSFWDTELALSDVILTTPGAPHHKLLECDRVLVDIQGAPLLRKKLVIRNARAVGLKIHPMPETNDVPVDQPAPDQTSLPTGWELAQPVREEFEQSFAAAIAGMRRELPAQAEAESLLKELAEKWPREVLELQDDLTIYELRAERLAEIAEQKDVEITTARQTLAELEALAEEMQALRRRLAVFEQAWNSDQTRLQSAAQSQLAFEAQETPIRIPSEQALSEYFASPEATAHVWELIRYLRQAREYLPLQPKMPEPEPGQGWAVVYPAKHPLPDFVLRALQFDGVGEIAGDAFHFAGSLQNVSNSPRLLGEPTRLVIDANIPQRVVIEALIDRARPEPSERVVIRCPNWPQPASRWGDAEQIALAASPSILSLRAELRMVGDELSGKVQMRHQQIAMQPKVADNWGGERMGRSLEDLLSQIEMIDTEVAIHGSLSAPRIQLRSSLGEKLSGGLRHALEQELAYRRQETLLARRARWEPRFTQLQSTMEQGSQEIQQRLAQTTTQVERVANLVESHVPADSRGPSQLSLIPTGSEKDLPRRK